MRNTCWIAIERAPKDGTEILGLTKRRKRIVAWWGKGRFNRMAWCGHGVTDIQLIKWCALPHLNDATRHPEIKMHKYKNPAGNMSWYKLQMPIYYTEEDI